MGKAALNPRITYVHIALTGAARQIDYKVDGFTVVKLWQSQSSAEPRLWLNFSPDNGISIASFIAIIECFEIALTQAQAWSPTGQVVMAEAA